ncbi:hypothetical protein GC176_02660 [bacterium]|nr:hypothetical protein [bacterium]
MVDSFWAGGADAYETGLREHYEALLRDLRTDLAECSDEVMRADCEARIAQAEAEYRSKLQDIGGLLF